MPVIRGQGHAGTPGDLRQVLVFNLQKHSLGEVAGDSEKQLGKHGTLEPSGFLLSPARASVAGKRSLWPVSPPVMEGGDGISRLLTRRSRKSPTPRTCSQRGCGRGQRGRSCTGATGVGLMSGRIWGAAGTGLPRWGAGRVFPSFLGSAGREPRGARTPMWDGEEGPVTPGPCTALPGGGGGGHSRHLLPCIREEGAGGRVHVATATHRFPRERKCSQAGFPTRLYRHVVECEELQFPIPCSDTLQRNPHPVKKNSSLRRLVLNL